MINLILWLAVGGLIGWAASIIMHTDAQQGVPLNIVVGIAGAMLGGWLFSPIGTINQGNFSMLSLLISLIGAVLLLAIVNLFRRRGRRHPL